MRKMKNIRRGSSDRAGFVSVWEKEISTVLWSFPFVELTLDSSAVAERADFFPPPFDSRLIRFKMPASCILIDFEASKTQCDSMEAPRRLLVLTGCATNQRNWGLIFFVLGANSGLASILDDGSCDEIDELSLGVMIGHISSEENEIFVPIPSRWMWRDKRFG